MKHPVFDSAWPDEIIALYNHDMQEIWDPTISPHIWNQYHNQLELYFSFAPAVTQFDILDVGCAQATLGILLAEMGHNVSVLDLRQEFLDYAATRYEHGDIRFIQGNVLKLDWETKFDLIFANQIIEHLVYPLEMINRLKSLLKPGGRLVITTPNGHYAKNALPCFTELGDPVQWEDKQFTADGDGHFYAYYGDELRELFVQAGFAENDINMQYFETPWISGHMKIRYLHGFVSGRILKKMDNLFLRIPLVAERLAHQLLITGTVAL